MIEHLQPLNDRVLVQRLATPPPAISIIIPEMATEPSYIGRVVAVGPGKYNEELGRRVPLSVAPGDTVVFGKYTDYDNGGFVVIQEADIRGILN